MQLRLPFLYQPIGACFGIFARLSEDRSGSECKELIVDQGEIDHRQAGGQYKGYSPGDSCEHHGSDLKARYPLCRGWGCGPEARSLHIGWSVRRMQEQAAFVGCFGTQLPRVPSAALTSLVNRFPP